jgi:alkylation response protein AidB-like acyl-CoA dehydrogenase
MPLNAAEQDLYDRTRSLCRERFAALAHEGTPGRLNRQVIKAMGDDGLIARLFPKSIGGAHDEAVSAIDLCILREALARESTEVETALALQGLGSYPILQSGLPTVVERWMPGICSGDVVPAFAMSEPDAGSDAAAMKLHAERAHGGYVLTGTKTWISNAPDADVYSVFARTIPGAGAKGVTAFCVPGDSDGLSGVSLDMISPHPIGRLDFDGVFVPDDGVLGEVNGGFKVAMRTLDLFRPSVGAFAVGMAQAALDAAVEWADVREAFGGKLRDLQAVAHKLADMAVATQAARLMVHDAARIYDARTGGGDSRVGDITVASSMAKLFATETAQRVVDDAVQIHGARALQKGHLLEALYRDVRAPRVYEGASEVQRTIIARSLYRG